MLSYSKEENYIIHNTLPRETSFEIGKRRKGRIYANNKCSPFSSIPDFVVAWFGVWYEMNIALPATETTNEINNILGMYGAELLHRGPTEKGNIYTLRKL